MTIGILQTGFTPKTLVGRFGQYDAMMARMLGPAFAFTTYDVTAGAYPKEVGDHDAYLITGSPAGVYDPLPWIEPLKSFLRQAGGRSKLVGICFGHQIMAEAFGGRVVKSPKGWGLGLHRYDVVKPASWMEDARPVAVAASHQDQVIEVPAKAEVLGGCGFTPFGMLAYPAQRAVSFQVHPEFEPEFAQALVNLDRVGGLGPAEAERAISSLREPDDRARVADWIRRFLAE